MKKINILLLLAVVISSTMFVSCKKVPSMTAEVDGVQKNFILRTTNKVKLKDGVEGMGLLAFTGGSEANSEYIAIVVRGAKNGTYDLDVNLENPVLKCEAIYCPRDTTGTIYKGFKGSVTITEISKKYISGKFEFQVRDKLLDPEIKRITKGEFKDLKYGTASSDFILKYFTE